MPLLYYYRPLQVTLDAFTQRFQLVVNDLGENYGYERQEIIAHFSYEFACLCFWLERPAYDPDLVDQALSATHTQALRDALTLITKIPTYEQKKVAERMGCSERSMPLPLDSFSKMATAILDVKTINDVSSLEIFNPLIKNLLDEIHSGEIKADVSLKNALSTLNWMAEKCSTRAMGSAVPSYIKEFLNCQTAMAGSPATAGRVLGNNDAPRQDFT